jgi:hypothetical protein
MACSSALARTAEISKEPHELVGAMKCSAPLAPMLAISWQCSWLELEEQAFAAQRGAHIGTASKARIVKTAITLRNVLDARDGIDLLILLAQRSLGQVGWHAHQKASGVDL